VGAVGGPITSNLDGRIAVVYNHSDGYMWNDLNNTPASGTNSEALRISLLYKPTSATCRRSTATSVRSRRAPRIRRHRRCAPRPRRSPAVASTSTAMGRPRASGPANGAAPRTCRSSIRSTCCAPTTRWVASP
jgi:hypothetical protein